MALLPSDVTIPTISDLSSAFSTIGTGAYNKIGSNYAAARKRAASDAAVRGFTGGPTDYASDRLGTQEGLDIGNLGAGMGGELGDAAYKDLLNQRSYGQQGRLAQATADAMRPSELEQIFSGIGGGATALGQGAALYGMIPKGTGALGGYAGSPVWGAEGGYGSEDPGYRWGYGSPNPKNAFGGN